MIIGDWLGRRATLSPDRVALIEGGSGSEVSYAVWNRRVNQVANWLQGELGVGKGTRVAMLAMNCNDYLDLWFACGKLGAILQNLNWRLSVAELAGLIEDAGPEVLVYGPDFKAQAEALRQHTSSVRHRVALGKPDQGERPFAEARQASEAAPLQVALTWDDPWVLCYTGGSTGLPKGVILTHGNITWNAINTVTSWGLRPDDVALLNAPLFHTGGLNVFTAPLVHIGGASILCRAFEPDQLFDLLAQRRLTLLFGVPTMFIMLQQHPRWAEADFSRCRLVISGGAPCPLPVFERFWEKGVDFKTGYGLTEAGPNTFWLPPAEVRSRPGAVGYPLMHVEVRTVHPDGSLCGPDEVGELLIRGPHVTPGYWNNPEATAAAIRDGWLHTGDLASYDADGAYRIVGRVKEMIISGGENIYPAEVESVMHGHPAVAEAALIGVPDDHWGEVGLALVALRPDERVTEAELRAYLRERLAGYKVPKRVVFVPILPKTGANKVDKQRLQRDFGERG